MSAYGPDGVYSTINQSSPTSTQMAQSSNGYTHGASYEGVNQYLESIKVNVIQEAENALFAYQDLEKVLRDNWKGQACANFIQNFEMAAYEVQRQLNNASIDITNKINSLYNSYITQDENMIEQVNVGGV